MFGRDVATGEIRLSDSDGFATDGPETVYDVLNDVPESMENTCFVPLASSTCTREQKLALLDGSAVLDGWVVVEPEGELPATIESKNPDRSLDSPESESDGSSLNAVGLASKLVLAAGLVLFFG